MRRSINTSQIRRLVFRILQEVVGYFCTKQSLRFWRFRLGWLQSGLPGAVCADGFAHGTGAGESRNLVAVRTRIALFCAIESTPCTICNLCKTASTLAIAHLVDLASGDVVQLVGTLFSHRHNHVSDLKISNLVQPTSVHAVTASAISLHFRKLVVRCLEVPDAFLLRDRSASRMANRFSSRTDR
jgi:hypothetical protein